MLVLLVKYTVILCAIMPPECYNLSIRRGIETAKQYLKSISLPDLDMCTPEYISTLCANETEAVCAIRLVSKKMEFKQFDNSCYMDLNNICESQDNIWAIKNFGPCVMNPDLRRYANAIKKMAANEPNDGLTKESDDKKTTDNLQEEYTYDGYRRKVVPAIRREQNERIVTATEDAEVLGDTTKKDNETAIAAEIKDAEAAETKKDNATISEENAPENTTDSVVDETSPVENPAETEDSVPVLKMANGEILRFDDDEIGKLFDANTGFVRPILRNARFPPLQRNLTFDNKAMCINRVKPCALIYLPVCIHYKREKPNEAAFYYFINVCEAQQWSCYHPEKRTSGVASMRTNFCSHVNYLQYARFLHTISAFHHYGWLHGPGRFNHMLKPHQRAS